MSEQPVLVCTAGPMIGARVAVPEEGLDLGRAEANGLVIDDADVSRFHARLQFDTGSLWLRDTGSRNGIYVNGKRLADHKALKVGDIIRIAEHTFEVCWEDDDGPDTGSASDAAPEQKARKRWFWPFDS